MFPVRELQSPVCLSPGETLEVRLSLASCCAGEIRKILQIKSDAGDSVRIDVTGRPSEAVVWNPRGVDFGRLEWNTSGQREVFLRSTGGGKLELLGPAEEETSVGGPFAAEWGPVVGAAAGVESWRVSL